MIRVVIADDHTIFRQGLAQLLRAAAEVTVVGEARDGDAALALVLDTNPMWPSWTSPCQVVGVWRWPRTS